MVADEVAVRFAAVAVRPWTVASASRPDAVRLYKHLAVATVALIAS